MNAKSITRAALDAWVDALVKEETVYGVQAKEDRFAYDRLERASDGDWHAEVTLPVCASGRSDWLAAFELVSGGDRTAFVVPFVAEK